MVGTAEVGKLRRHTLAPTLVMAGMGVATYSVVRYELWIVAAYTVLAALLAAWLLSARSATSAGPFPWVLPFALVTVLQLTVRPYTYLSAEQGWVTRGVLAASAALAGVALLVAARTRSARWADAGLVIAVVGYVVTAVLLIRWDPRPKIDVWVMLQQAADGILRGENLYAQNWTGSPGVQDAFTYLPFTGLLLAPGRWLAGDVRWTLVVLTLLGVLAVRLLGRRSRRPEVVDAVTDEQVLGRRVNAAAAAALILVLPGTQTQVEQAWTEPLLMACLAGWALGVHRRNTALAVVCLALGVASKQHLVLLLPLLAAWPRFGPRRTIAAAGLAGLFVLPWFIASPADMWHDAVTVLIDFQPLLFADTLYITAIQELSWTPPFWLTGAIIIGTVAAAAVLIRRRDPDLAVVLRWCALVLMVASLVNKQAFYNQYWLVAALVLMSFAVPASDPPEEPEPATDAPQAAVAAA